MTKSDDKKLAALARKNAARAVTPKAKLRRQYDDTLPSEREEDLDHRQLFKEMKKREF